MNKIVKMGNQSGKTISYTVEYLNKIDPELAREFLIAIGYYESEDVDVKT